MLNLAANWAGAPVIVGAGLAGMMTALKLSPRPVILLNSGADGHGTATGWALGGIAAAIDLGDSAECHAADTIEAGAGLADPAIVAAVTRAAPQAIADLIDCGVAFDRDCQGQLSLNQEAAHRHRRVVHAHGDSSGAEIARALLQRVRETSSILVIEQTRAVALVLDENGAIAGLWVSLAGGSPDYIATSAIVLASGGIGGLYRETTNPLGSFGQGLALAARVGAILQDLEFVQFHPTAIAAGLDPMPLASEALRGDGASLIDRNGLRLMADLPQGDLAPRDIVARRVYREWQKGGAAALDCRVIGAELSRRFPSFIAACDLAGFDPAQQPIPVRVAAHYHMGGVAVDQAGRSSVQGLWACGEVACTGLHGANRLASNSLLEGAVYAGWIAQDIDNKLANPRKKIADFPPPGALSMMTPSAQLRRIMADHVGVIRDEEGLSEAIRFLAAQDLTSDAALAGVMIAVAAWRRRESRGGHWRQDYPMTMPSVGMARTLTIEETLAIAATLTEPVQRSPVQRFSHVI